MKEENFKLKADSPYIDLLSLLKATQLAQSGGEAKMLVDEGLVYVNQEQEFRKRRKLYPGDVVVFETSTISILQ